MKKRSFLDQKGFTLIEVMVASGLFVILSLAIVRQIQLAESSKKASAESTIINSLIDRVAVELSKQEVCTLNFKGQDTTATKTFLNNEFIKAIDNTSLLKKTANYGAATGAGKTTRTSSTQADLVQVKDIVLKPNPSDSEQMILEITVTKKIYSYSIFSPNTQIFRLPITVIKQTTGNTNLIDYCHNDITNSIQAAIRLSCNGGNTDYYDPATNPPYGACFHSLLGTNEDSVNSCPPNQFLKRLEYDDTAGNHTIKYTCAGLNQTCPVGQVLNGFNSDGTPNCDYPFPNCGSGYLMIKASTGKYKCITANAGLGCSSFYAIQSIDETGFTCKPYYPGNTCAGGAYVYSATPGNIQCAGSYRAKVCNPGEFVTSFDGAGNPSCTKWLTVPFTCPGGTGATGVAANGDLTCQPLQRRLSCNGTISSRSRNACTSAGGALYPGGNSNTHCIFNASACPGGWSQCPTYATRTAATCTDTNSACSYSTMVTRNAPAAGYGTPVTAQTVTCDYWARNSGPWVRSCTQYVGWGPSQTTAITQVGCY